MPHLKLATHYFGTDAQPELAVEVTDVVAHPLTPSLVEGTAQPLGQGQLRVRVDGVSPSDMERMRGTVWGYGSVTDARGSTHAGKLSALESRSDGSLEFIISREM